MFVPLFFRYVPSILKSWQEKIRLCSMLHFLFTFTWSYAFLTCVSGFWMLWVQWWIIGSRKRLSLSSGDHLTTGQIFLRSDVSGVAFLMLWFLDTTHLAMVILTPGILFFMVTFYMLIWIFFNQIFHFYQFSNLSNFCSDNFSVSEFELWQFSVSIFMVLTSL